MKFECTPLKRKKTCIAMYAQPLVFFQHLGFTLSLPGLPVGCRREAACHWLVSPAVRSALASMFTCTSPPPGPSSPTICMLSSPCLLSSFFCLVDSKIILCFAHQFNWKCLSRKAQICPPVFCPFRSSGVMCVFSVCIHWFQLQAFYCCLFLGKCFFSLECLLQL